MFEVEGGGEDGIATMLPQVQEAVTDFGRFGGMCHLKAFTPFASAEDALANINDVSEGICNETLNTFLEMNLPKVSIWFIVSLCYHIYGCMRERGRVVEYYVLYPFNHQYIGLLYIYVCIFILYIYISIYYIYIYIYNIFDIIRLRRARKGSSNWVS